MRPDASVLLLTTLIGAGQGLFLALFTVQAYALFGLLLDLPSMRKKYGKTFDWHLGRMLLPFRLVGAVRYDYRKDWLYLTPQGRYYWVVMMREFFTAVNNFRDYCRE